jgi:hypothetical protein
MQTNTTGLFGFQNGLKFLKTKTCACGRSFNGPGEKCDICYNNKNYIQTNNCTIENFEGRCEEYLTCPHYDDCLTKAADKNWIGWRKVHGR